MPVSDPRSAPLRVAVVGSGPSGFFATAPLLENGALVDMFERLPTPWGLVRSGVAPDHPKIKAVSNVFERLAEHPGFQFFGNIEIGANITVEDLEGHYDAVVWATGAQTARPLGIPGEHLAGSHSALEFVSWYNGHPDYSGAAFNLEVERVVVIGNGNVSLDCARMLSLSHAELAATDTADGAIAALGRSRVREIVVAGRRGPLEASFTTPELLELGQLSQTTVSVDPAELEVEIPSDLHPSKRRNLDCMANYQESDGAQPRRRLQLRFCISPVEILGHDRVEAVVLERNTLERTEAGVTAVPTGERETVDCGLILSAVGLRTRPIPGLAYDPLSGTIANTRGRVRNGHYCVGWAKRGPSGVIGTNKKDASETVALLMADAHAGRLLRPSHASQAEVAELLDHRQSVRIDYGHWRTIDAHERAAGQRQDRPRVKLSTWADLLCAARGTP